MKVSRFAKEILADLVFTMKMGQVFIGLLWDATHLENLYPGYQGMLSVEDPYTPSALAEDHRTFPQFSGRTRKATNSIRR